MSFLGFCPNAFIISKKNHLHFFELIKDEAALKIRYASMYFEIVMQSLYSIYNRI
jgi:hypothetical protein